MDNNKKKLGNFNAPWYEYLNCPESVLGEQAGDAEIQVSQQEQEARPQEDGQGRGQGRCFLTGSQAPVNLTNCRAQGQRWAIEESSLAGGRPQKIIISKWRIKTIGTMCYAWRLMGFFVDGWWSLGYPNLCFLCFWFEFEFIFGHFSCFISLTD